MSMKRFRKLRYIIPAAVILGPIAVVGFAYVIGTIVMLLWNWLLPPLFGWRELTVWQAFGLLALCRILFGGFGGGGSSGGSRDITPHERERFRQKMRERFGCATVENEHS